MNLDQWIKERPYISVEQVKHQHNKEKTQVWNAIIGIIVGIALFAVTTNFFHPTYNIWGLMVWLGENYG